MGYMGLETPIEMPSMGIYNTDLMKMYIAGVKDQYEKGQEEMKDFMKTYGDFYSDIPGATEAYNNMTIGGARNMINQMLANGIDPYKSPEARAAISRYIAGVPTGLLNQMKKSAENAALYKKALAEALNDPNFDPEYNKYMLGGDLESWDPRKPWTALAPYVAPSAEDSFKQYMEKFKQSEILPKDEQDRPGYIKVGTTKENKQGALRAALENYEKTPYGQYKRQQANQIAAEATNPDGTPLTPEQRYALAQSIFEQPAKDYAMLFFQPAYEFDKIAQERRQNAQAERMEGIRHSNSMIEKGHKWNSKTKQWEEKPTKSEIDAYLPLNESTLKGINEITRNGKHSFADVLKRRLHNARVRGLMKNADDTLSMFATSNDKNQYFAWSGKDKYKDVQSTIYYDSGDEENYYSAQEVLAFIDPVHYKPGKHGEGVRATIKRRSKEEEQPSISDTGDVISVMSYDDGNIYSFRRIIVDNNYMYEPTGYVYDSNGNLIVNSSYGAIQKDYRVGQIQYEGKNPSK